MTPGHRVRERRKALIRKISAEIHTDYPRMTLVCFTHDAPDGNGHIWCCSVSRGVAYVREPRGFFRMKLENGNFDFSVKGHSHLEVLQKTQALIPKRMYRKG